MIVDSASYYTYIAHGDLSGAPFQVRSNFSNQPITDSILSETHAGWLLAGVAASPTNVMSLANAEQYETSRGYAEAHAEVDVHFSPEVDTAATLILEMVVRGQFAYGGNEIQITDVSENIVLWNIYDHGLAGGNVPWVYNQNENWLTASLMPTLELSASHQYWLHMSSWGSSANPDWDSRDTTIMGLEFPVNVPEPSLVNLAALCLCIQLIRRKSELAWKAWQP